MANSELTPATGVLLIAPPMMDDPNFKRTIILLCEHGAEGSFGLILNRTLSLQLNEVVDGMTGYTGFLSQGGPVLQNTLHVLHRIGARVGETREVVSEVYWGGDFDAIQAILASREASEDDFRFFLGYAGWSPGQLETEIEQGGWILAISDESMIFSAEPKRLWSDTLRRLGGEFALLANYPEDPRMN
ncbi:MAG: YqgE/AlgH family protein [Rhodothermales bacterium]|nr:YqgE/AlgH family protein [Rhodothermales bacterium]